ncbi:MAG TPA: hypothetical protein VM368_07420, partial [Flavisolibacter sp.]|nr:hypothetical protein [Flavisolibacter sp.]
MRSVPVICCIAFVLLSFAGKDDSSWKIKTEKAEFIHRAIKQVTDVMVHDIYSPPVASRTYAYISIAGYEAAIAGDVRYQTLAGQLRGLRSLPRPKAGREYSFTLASVHAILTVAKTMVISEQNIENFY